LKEVTMGLLGFMMVTMVLLTNLDDPAKIAPGFASALCSILYALLLSGVLVRSMQEQIRLKEVRHAECEGRGTDPP